MRFNFKNPALAALAAVADTLDARMEYLDAQTLLSDVQALTATAVSTNTYDSTVAATDIGVGLPQLVAEISVDVGAGGTTPTFTFNIITSAAANLGSATTLSSMTVAAALLVAGYKFYMPFPPGKTQRYVGLSYTLGGTSPTLSVTANIKPLSMTETLKYNAANYTIS